MSRLIWLLQYRMYKKRFVSCFGYSWISFRGKLENLLLLLFKFDNCPRTNLTKKLLGFSLRRNFFFCVDLKNDWHFFTSHTRSLLGGFYSRERIQLKYYGYLMQVSAISFSYSKRILVDFHSEILCDEISML